jgi:CheY-like chemotaxis protein
MRAMTSNPCPACQHLNAPQVQRCGACGVDLGAWDALPRLVPTLPMADSVGALWLRDLRQPEAEQRPVEVPDEMSLSLTLRDITLAPEPSTPVEATAAEVPVPRVSAAPADDAALRAERKAAKRAEVRRARLRDAASANGPASVTPEVLVLTTDDASREHLCALLRAFGFGVPAMAKQPTPPEARPIVAVFVDIDVEIAGGGDGIDLCQQIRDADRRRADPAPLLVLVAGRLRPVDQVRATLAGCDEILLKPVTRGSVASVLDGRGIALPSDARHL